MKATLFIDDLSNEFKQLVHECASRNYNSFRFVPCIEKGLIHAWLTEAIHPSSEHFVGYITEEQTPADANVSYALFCARIPVLTLKPCQVGLSSLLFSPANVSSTKKRDAPLSLAELVDSFLPWSSSSMDGVFVVEGGDGVGKQTQTKLLFERLRSENFPVQTIDFPNERVPYGGLIRVILSGKKGSISDLDPMLFSFIFSLNRYECLPELRLWTRREQFVLCDRYYTSNFGYQAAKLPKKERASFIRNLERLEVAWLGLPPCLVTFYLDLPPEIAMQAMQGDVTRKYLDIHETAGDTYKETIRDIFLWCCDELDSFRWIMCCDSSGVRHTPQMLHKEIYTALIRIAAFKS